MIVQEICGTLLTIADGYHKLLALSEAALIMTIDDSQSESTAKVHNKYFLLFSIFKFHVVTSEQLGLTHTRPVLK